MSRNFDANIKENWDGINFTIENIDDIINSPNRQTLSERDLKYLFSTLNIVNLDNFFEEYVNEKEKKKYKKIIIDKLETILKIYKKNLNNFNKKNLDKYYEVLFYDYKKLFGKCTIQPELRITKFPLSKTTEDELKGILDTFNLESNENDSLIIPFDNIHQYYIFLMIILAGDPLHDYTESRLSQFRNERGVKNIRTNYVNIAKTLYDEYESEINKSYDGKIESAVKDIRDVIVKQTNIEENLMKVLMFFNIRQPDKSKLQTASITSLNIYENIKRFLDEQNKGSNYRFASVNSVSRIHANDKEPNIIQNNGDVYHTHFIEKSMNKTQYCLPSTMIDGCKGCCDDFTKVYNYSQSDESDRFGIGVELGNINIKFTYKDVRGGSGEGEGKENYLTIKSKIIRENFVPETSNVFGFSIGEGNKYYYQIQISRKNDLLGRDIVIDEPFIFKREIYPNVDDITVSKMFDKYSNISNTEIYGNIFDNADIVMNNGNAHKYTEKMLCDFLQGASCYFKWGGYEGGIERIKYFPEDNNILKYDYSQEIMENLTNFSNGQFNGNCIRVTEHTDRPAALLCHFILQTGLISINEFAHSAYLGDRNGFLSNIQGIVVETLNLVDKEESLRKKTKRGGGYIENQNYESYINSDTRQVSDQNDVIVLFKNEDEKSENDILIFADELPNNDTIRWASGFNYNEEQIFQINFITILVILNLDENELDENEKQFVKFLKLDIHESIKPDVNNIYYKRYKHFFASIEYFKNHPERFKDLFGTSIPIEVVLEKIVGVLQGFRTPPNKDEVSTGEVKTPPLLQPKQSETITPEQNTGKSSQNRIGDPPESLLSKLDTSLTLEKSGETIRSPVELNRGFITESEEGSEKSSDEGSEKSSDDGSENVNNKGGSNIIYKRKTQKKKYKNKNKKTQNKVNNKRRSAHKRTYKKKYVKSKRSSYKSRTKN